MIALVGFVGPIMLSILNEELAMLYCWRLLAVLKTAIESFPVRERLLRSLFKYESSKNCKNSTKVDRNLSHKLADSSNEQKLKYDSFSRRPGLLYASVMVWIYVMF